MKDKNKTHCRLIVGDVYWIFDGTMKPFQAVLENITDLNYGSNPLTAPFDPNGVLCWFGTVPRVRSSVYISKEQALKINKY